MIPLHSAWLAAHGKLWYDDKWYRYAWILWPQALAAVIVMLFWAAPPGNTAAEWAKPVDPATRFQQMVALRESAKSNRQAMDTLEREARGGDMNAEFLFATLYDPGLKISTIVPPDIEKAAAWYNRAAAQGHQFALNNLALFYYSGTFTRLDYTRACYYALRLDSSAPGNGLLVKGDCYARGLGGTKVDQAQAESAYRTAQANGATRPPPVEPAQAPSPAIPAPAPFIPAPPSRPSPAPPEPNPPDNSTNVQWGAIAFTADGSYSTAWKMPSQAEAEAKVATQCASFGRGGCRTVSFSGQECVALATFIGSYSRRRWQLSFTAGGMTYPEAQNAALNRCNEDERSRGRCQSRIAACADGR
jgi:TPR repeat protein